MMYHKILVPMALDHNVSVHTLEIARALCSGTGEIIALHVHEAPQSSVKAYLDEEIVEAGYARAEAMLHDKLKDVAGVTPQMVSGHASRSIIDYANANGIDCIIIGSHKPGLSDYFLGSTASRVVRHASCAVHVHRSD